MPTPSNGDCCGCRLPERRSGAWPELGYVVATFRSSRARRRIDAVIGIVLVGLRVRVALVSADPRVEKVTPTGLARRVRGLLRFAP